MRNTPFFLTTGQRHNARPRISKHPFEFGSRPKTRKAVEVCKGLVDLHGPRPYLSHLIFVKFSKSLKIIWANIHEPLRRQRAKIYPH